jgi:hypothetical protein
MTSFVPSDKMRREIVILVDPSTEKLRRLSRRTCVTLPSARPALADITLAPGLTLPAYHLPIRSRANTGTIALGNPSSSIKRNDIKLLIAIERVVSAANFRRAPVTAVASSASKADPIIVRRRMNSVAARLPKPAVMPDDIGFVMLTFGNVFFDDGKLA